MSECINTGAEGISDETQTVQRRRGLGQRHVVILLLHLGNVVDYCMRVNLSVAVVAMVNSTGTSPSPNTSSHQCPVPHEINISEKAEVPGPKYAWTKEQQGLVLSAFFWGYFTLQIPAGSFAQKYGAKKIFGISIFLAAILTLLTPLMASVNIYMFIGVRVLEGIIRSVSYPTMAAMLGRWVPPQESTLLLNIADSGNVVGTIIGQLMAGPVSASEALGGWPAVFYISGGAAVLWFIPWCFFVFDSPASHPRISQEERHYIETSVGKNQEVINSVKIPWRRILSSAPMWAYAINLTCSSYIFFTFLTILPQFLSEVLHFDISSDGILSSLPYIVYIITGSSASVISDKIIATGKFSKTRIRKFFSILSMWGAGICVFSVTLVNCNAAVVIVLLNVGYAIYGTMYAGFYTGPLDLAPEYAGTVFGISNTIGSLTGILTPILTDEITRHKTIQEWNIVFYITAGVTGFGGIVFLLFGSGKRQPWSGRYTSEESNLIVEEYNDDGVSDKDQKFD